MNILDAIFIKCENLSFEEYLNLDDNEKANIKSSKIIPATLEPDNNFGGICVEYQNPIFKVA